MACSIAINDLRARLEQGQQRLREHYFATRDVQSLLNGRSSLIDNLLSDTWNRHQLPASASLLAVGGYGRKELYPASDIDLLILIPENATDQLAQTVALFIRSLWDIGLEIGHSVRTIRECLESARNEISIQTALLEARYLIGNQALFDHFHTQFWHHINPLQFFTAKRAEQDERHHRYHDSPYSLEPNVKESPGGLRDLQVILWISQAAQLGKHWSDLEIAGFITAEEHIHLMRCETTLQQLRVRLHYHTKRREDRLLFDYQAHLATQLGFTPRGPRLASEILMQDYYRNAKSVTQLNVILLQLINTAIHPSAHTTPHPINPRFQILNDQLDIVHEQVFTQNPSALLESFLLLQRHPELQGMTARTLRALYRGRNLIDETFRANPKNRTLFMQILQQNRGVVHEFRRMNQYGILGRYLPAFGAIIGQMQHDLFHVYTVDQHILIVLRNLRRFTLDEFAHEYPFCTQLISEFKRPWLLYIAAFFHDIAKGRGGDHSELGTQDALQFCQDHQLSTEDTELVTWLVLHHLDLSRVAQKQDISDPNVIAAFASTVRDERHLTALYLLTVADIRGTSPKVWNSWKDQLLRELYQATLNYLTQGGNSSPTTGIIEERQKEALRLLRYFALPDAAHATLWQQLDTLYFLRHSAEEIAWHTRSLYENQNARAVIKARLNAQGEGVQVMVYTLDQADLFAHLVGFFSRAGYNIVDAKIHTTQNGYALDSFMLLDTTGRDHERAMLSYIEHELRQSLYLTTPPEAPYSRRISRQVQHFPITPIVTLTPDDSGENFVLSIIAADRPGLLYEIAMILVQHGANLHTAKIATLGERAEDTFLISGGDLQHSNARLKLETELQRLLNRVYA